MSGPIPLEFITSVPEHDLLPPAVAEVAFVGRSNVGKSSLINSLAGRKKIAHTSKSPGRTRALNCFAVSDGRHLVDCPGYGYAAVPTAERDRWRTMMERYLLEREPLVMVAALVDGEVGPTSLDISLFEWLDANGIPYSVIATKHDKIRPSKLDKRKRDLASGCGVEMKEVIWVSAVKGTGVDRLRGQVRQWLLN